MGNLIDHIVDFTGIGFIPIIGDIVKASFHWVWDKTVMPVLEEAVKLFGIKDEDVISTAVFTQRIIADDNSVKTLMTQLALAHQKDPDRTVIEKFIQMAAPTRDRYSAYFRYGRDTYVNGLPTTSLGVQVIDLDEIKVVLDSVIGTSTTIVSGELRFPTDDEYVDSYLQTAYNYDPTTREAVIYDADSGLYIIYVVSDVIYNIETNNFDVTLTSYEDVTTTILTTTEVAVAVLDDTTDTVTKTVTEQTIKVSNIRGEFENTTVEISTYSYTVPTGTVSSNTSTVAGSTLEYDVIYKEIIEAIPMYNITHYYVVKYYTTVEAEWKYWLYDPTTNVYPSLSISVEAVANLDMLPIVVLRNGTVNITADKESDEYKHSKKLCDFIGIDIDSMVENINDSDDIASVEDAFIHFALDPKDTSEVVSETLYSMFNYIGQYTDIVKKVENGVARYRFTMEEGPVNLVLAWTDQKETEIVGSIGSVGTYAHEIEDKTIFMRKQITVTTYLEIQIDDVSSGTFIGRQGLVGFTAASPADDGFVIPISYQFINKLSPLKQVEVFAKSLQLSIYAAEVTHLEWYQTERFMKFVQIVGFVIMVVITVVTLGAGAPLWAIMQQILINLAIGYLTTLALLKLYEQTGNEFLRGILTVAIIVAAVYFQQSATAGEFLTAAQLTSAVTQSATSVVNVASQVASIGNQVSGILLQEEFKELEAIATAFSAAAEKRTTELEEASEAITSGLTTDFAALLKRWVDSGAYLESVDLFMYKSIQIQYDFDLLYDYSTMKDDYYNNKLRLGVL